MKDNYDFSEMERITHPLQDKIDSGKVEFNDPFGVSEIEFQENLAKLSGVKKEYAIKRRQLWKNRQKAEKLKEQLSQLIAQEDPKVVTMPLYNLLVENLTQNHVSPELIHTLNSIERLLIQI